jgi:hypothetical protein
LTASFIEPIPKQRGHQPDLVLAEKFSLVRPKKDDVFEEANNSLNLGNIPKYDPTEERRLAKTST